MFDAMLRPPLIRAGDRNVLQAALFRYSTGIEAVSLSKHHCHVTVLLCARGTRGDPDRASTRRPAARPEPTAARYGARGHHPHEGSFGEAHGRPGGAPGITPAACHAAVRRYAR
jgi:hypothetical protein